jgi:glutamate dehydrogenase
VSADCAQRYLVAFPQAFQEDFDVVTALADIRRLEALAAQDGLDLCLHLPLGTPLGRGG